VCWCHGCAGVNVSVCLCVCVCVCVCVCACVCIYKPWPPNSVIVPFAIVFTSPCPSANTVFLSTILPLSTHIQTEFALTTYPVSPSLHNSILVCTFVCVCALVVCSSTTTAAAAAALGCKLTVSAKQPCESPTHTHSHTLSHTHIQSDNGS
jgi:hypothetical protein